MISARTAIILLVASSGFSSTLNVGPGKIYSRIEQAYSAAAAGDTILVYPKTSNAAYDSVAVYLAKQKLLIRGMDASGRVTLLGTGYDYSGSGSIPRAMFQFNPGADSCIVENFDISGCRNASYNGAAIRINQVNNITVRNCEIHGNDMGLMSNGSLAANTAANQLIENCVVHDNGATADPGYNHNFYMGGTSVVIRGCNIYSATTGHDVKSRAHITIVEGCYVHDCQNREFDLVDDSGNTTAVGSHALLAGCVIVKANNATGNKTVIHFGQDGGFDHTGTLYVVQCTIVTPYVSPVADLSAPGAGVSFTNTIVTDPSGSASGQVLVNARNGALMSNAAGHYLWVSHGFPMPAGGVFDHVTTGASGVSPKFVNATSGDYGLADSAGGIVDAGQAYASISLPQQISGRQLVAFRLPIGFFNRTFVGAPDIGAYEWKSDASAAVIGSLSSVKTKTAATLAFYDLKGRLLRGGSFSHTKLLRVGICVETSGDGCKRMLSIMTR